MKKYNTDIPGWMSIQDLNVLQTLAGYVPENGSILEIGCFLGRSTSALFAGKHDSVKLEVVDTFEYNENYSIFNGYNLNGDIGLFLKVARLARKENSWKKSFEFCVGDEICNNIDIHEISSEKFITDKIPDMVFIDADHTIDAVIKDITKFMNTDTLIVGDDFIPNWNNSVPVAIALVREDYPYTLVVPAFSKIWFMIPPIGIWKDIFKKNNIFF